MTDAANVIKDWWFAIMALVAVTVWLVRLEARSFSNSAQNTARRDELVALELRLERQRKEDMSVRKADRDEMQEMLREMREDIKLLLQRK